MEDLNIRLSKAVRKLTVICSSDKLFNSLSISEITLLSFLNSNLTDTESKSAALQMKDIANELGISRSALSQTVNKLEAKQILHRIALSNGKRATYLKFTENGYTLFCNELAAYNSKISSIISAIGEAECSKFAETAEKIAAAISAHE